MGTSSSIGILNDDNKTVKYVYCHWDGHLKHNGKILKEHYNTKEKLLQLVDNKISSVLCGIYEDGSFDYSPNKEELGYIYPDIGLDEYRNKTNVNYVYLFYPLQNKWTVLESKQFIVF